MYVGNLEKYQGIDLLLESFQLVTAKSRTGNLVIIGGNAADINTYRNRSRQLGIDKRTYFIGPKPTTQLASFLRQADILVSPRIRGGNTPMKIYSYLDSGKPVLATRLPTHTQVLDDKIAILTMPEPEAMAQGFIALITDKRRGSIIAEMAKERVRSEYSREVFEKKLLAFYKNLEKIILVDKLDRWGGTI
jgi:glycosyltransferase involved in cell wall biosynthesis